MYICYVLCQTEFNWLNLGKCSEWGCDEAGKYSHSSNASIKFTIRQITNTNASSYSATRKLHYTCI